MNVIIVKEVIKARPKTFILIFALLLLNIGLYLYVSVKQAPQLASLQDRRLEKRKFAPGGAALDTAAVYRQGEAELKAWRARVIPKKEFARYIGNLFETAANNSLAFKGVSYKATQLKNENLATYALDFNVAGKYPAVKSFIADLGRMREIMTIDNIALSTGKAAEDDVSLKVQLTVYLRMEEQ